MAVTESGEIKTISATTSDGKADFSYLVAGVYIKTDADVYIAFDRAATTDDFLLEAADLVVELNVPCTEVHAITSGGSANVYIIGRR